MNVLFSHKNYLLDFSWMFCRNVPWNLFLLQKIVLGNIGIPKMDNLRAFNLLHLPNLNFIFKPTYSIMRVHFTSFSPVKEIEKRAEGTFPFSSLKFLKHKQSGTFSTLCVSCLECVRKNAGRNNWCSSLSNLCKYSWFQLGGKSNSLFSLNCSFVVFSFSLYIA